MSDTIVLVDAQRDFWENVRGISSRLKVILLQAKINRQNLVVLEFTAKYYGPTHGSLKKIIRTMDSDQVYFVEKHHDNGTREVLAAMKDGGFDLNGGIDICGVNLCHCVKHTAFGLAKHTKVRLLKHATSCWKHCKCRTNDKSIIKRYTYRGISIDEA